MNRHLAAAIFLSAMLPGLAGCATTLSQKALDNAGPAVELTGVPFFAQEKDQCGPAALASLLVASGVSVTPAQLTPQLFVPERQGALQAELMAATRRHGRVAYHLPDSLPSLLDSVRAGVPVLVLQNNGYFRWPVWHYAVVIGFDPDHQRFLLHTGSQKRASVRAKSFLKSWDMAGRWAMLVTKPSEPPPVADAGRWLRAVQPFESGGDLETAAQGYEAAVARWPEDAASWIALGNVRYTQKLLDDAERAYMQALQRAPEENSPFYWIARNNLAQARLVRDGAKPE